MNQFNVILALIFSLVIAIFALANNQPIEMNYLYGKAEISAIIVILGAAILGALTIFLLNIFKQIKTGLRLRSLQGQLNELGSRVDELTAERDALLMQIGQLQESLNNAYAETAKTAGEPPAYESFGSSQVQDKGTDEIPIAGGSGFKANTEPGIRKDSTEFVGQAEAGSNQEKGISEKEDEKKF